MATSSHQQMPSLRWAELPAVRRLDHAVPARTHRIPSGSLLACLPSPTRVWNCWLWEGMPQLRTTLRSTPTEESACLPFLGQLRVSTVSFCLKSKGMDLRLTEGLAGRPRATLRLYALSFYQVGSIHNYSKPPGDPFARQPSRSQRVVPRTC